MAVVCILSSLLPDDISAESADLDVEGCLVSHNMSSANNKNIICFAVCCHLTLAQSHHLLSSNLMRKSSMGYAFAGYLPVQPAPWCDGVVCVIISASCYDSSHSYNVISCRPCMSYAAPAAMVSE
jgi:hypothetical protein